VFGQVILSVSGMVLIRAAAVQIGAESPELELAIVEQWISSVAKFLNRGSALHFDSSHRKRGL
jgi:hypothetical protein